MKNPEENQNHGIEQIPKTIIQGNVSHRENGLKFHIKEVNKP